MYKKREFLQGTFGERNIILEQLFDRITFWSRVFFFFKKNSFSSCLFYQKGNRKPKGCQGVFQNPVKHLRWSLFECKSCKVWYHAVCISVE